MIPKAMLISYSKHETVNNKYISGGINIFVYHSLVFYIICWIIDRWDRGTRPEFGNLVMLYWGHGQIIN